MYKFSEGIADHIEAVHGGVGHTGLCEGVAKEYPEKDIQGKYDKSCVVCREERFIKKLSLNTLTSVCKECFGPIE